MNNLQLLTQENVLSRAQKLCLVVFIGLVMFLFPINVVPVYAVENRSIGGRPAYPRVDNPRTQSIFIHTGNPGAIIKDGVEIVNNSDQTKIISVYAADYVRSSDGAFACAQESDTSSKVGNWINLAQSEVTLNKHSTKVVDFSINVPADAEPGEQNGCIVIQEKGAAPVNSGNGISLTFRSAMRVAITVPGAIVKGLNIKSFELMTDEQTGKRNFEAVVENTGNVSLDTQITVILTDFLGKQVELLSGVYPILSNNTQKLNAAVPDSLWLGWYQGDLKVNYDANVGNQLGITTNTQQRSLESDKRWLFVMPDWKIALIVVALALLLSFLFKKHAFFTHRLKK